MVMNKKGMELNELYQFVLLLVLIALIVGVGVLILDKFGGTEGITSSTNTTLQNAATAIGGISNSWLTLIVTIGVLAIILTLVIRSFSLGQR